ncbi:hypothetical protein SRHO_G00281020 [Serrasalmus rhombeus]
MTGVGQLVAIGHWLSLSSDPIFRPRLLETPYGSMPSLATEKTMGTFFSSLLHTLLILDLHGNPWWLDFRSGLRI